jgi:hypothetical protein
MPELAVKDLNLPASVSAALNRLRDDLARAAGPNLAGLILYGGLARGRYRPGQSDANLVILLREVTAPALAAITPALKAAWRSIRVEPFIMTPGEVPAAAVAFATKFLDIKDHHVVLSGEDPFVNLSISLADLRTDVAESLRNLRFRMRQRFTRFGDDKDELTVVLSGFARPLAIEVAALLRCAGKEFTAEDRSTAIFAAAADAFGLDGPTLARLAGLRQSEGAAADAVDLYGRVLAVLGRVIEVVDGMKAS